MPPPLTWDRISKPEIWYLYIFSINLSTFADTIQRPEVQHSKRGSSAVDCNGYKSIFKLVPLVFFGTVCAEINLWWFRKKSGKSQFSNFTLNNFKRLWDRNLRILTFYEIVNLFNNDKGTITKIHQFSLNFSAGCFYLQFFTKLFGINVYNIHHIYGLLWIITCSKSGFLP